MGHETYYKPNVYENQPESTHLIPCLPIPGIAEQLVEAATHDQPLPLLAEVDKSLIRLRAYLRLSRDLKLLSSGQYEHASRMAAEVGRLLGGWIKSKKEKHT